MRTAVYSLIALLITASQSYASPRTVTIHMSAMNGTNEDGTATLTEDGNQTIVLVTLANGTSVRQPSHLHSGSCDDYTPRPAYALHDVVNGSSRTVVPEHLDKLISGTYILNVHKSYDDIATQASCGVVKP
jgi:hypothetical protein